MQGLKVEKWKYIKGYGRKYKISSFGRVINSETGTELKHYIDKNGFHSVCLCKNGNVSRLCVHKLVAYHFIGNPQNFDRIAFLDGNKDNLNVGNLRFCNFDGLKFYKSIANQ